MGEQSEEPDESFTAQSRRPATHSCLIVDLHPAFRQRREHHVLHVLLQMVPGLEDCLVEGSEDDLVSIAAMVSHSLLFSAVWPPCCS